MPFRTQRGSLTASRSKELTPKQPTIFCAHDIGAVSDCRLSITCRGLIKGPVVRLHLAITPFIDNSDKYFSNINFSSVSDNN